MMYQIILASLKAKFAGVSENVLVRIAKNLAKTATTEEQVKAAVDGVTLQQVIDSYADGRATEATQTAVHNYEAKYGLKDGAKVTTQGGEPQPIPTQKPTPEAEQTPEWAKALIDANKALTDRIAKMEGERTVSTRKQQISDIVSKLPEALRKPYDRISLDTMSEEDFKTLVSEVSTEVDGISKDFNTKGAVFGRPSNGGQGNKGDDLTKEQEAAISSRSGSPAEGQPF